MLDIALPVSGDGLWFACSDGFKSHVGAVFRRDTFHNFLSRGGTPLPQFLFNR
jgi:hypothetical protein